MANVKKAPNVKSRPVENRSDMTKTSLQPACAINNSAMVNEPGDIKGPPLVLPTLLTGLGTRYFETMEKNRDKIHHVDALTGITETKNSVKSRAIKVAIELRKRGVKENNVVLICSKCHMDQTVALLGCLFVGAIISSLHSDNTYEDIKRFVVNLQPKLAFCGNRSARLLMRVLKEKNIRCPIYLFHGEAANFINFDKCFHNKDDPTFTTTEIKNPKASTVFIVCTPGTECAPKLVSITHYAMMMRYMPFFGNIFIKSEKVISLFPMSAVMQLMISFICFESSAKQIYIKQYTERSICKYIHDLRVENLFLDGDLATRIVRNAPVGDFDLTCLKVIFVTNPSLTANNFVRLARAFRNVTITTNYSTVETGIVTVITQETFFKNKDKLHSVGQLFPGVSIRIADTLYHKVVNPASWGELLVKTPGLMSGYFKNQLATQKALCKGFFKTGDLVQYDNDGFLFIKGRLSEQISRDNQMFSAVDIDMAMKSHPDVADAASFVNETGEIVGCVVKKPGRDLTVDIVMEYIADILPPYKHPNKVVFREYLPKTLTGFVKKYELKDGLVEVIRENSFYHSEHTDSLSTAVI